MNNSKEPHGDFNPNLPFESDSPSIAVDTIRQELSSSSLNQNQKQFYESNIAPLLLLMDSLSRVSFNLSTSVNVLTNSSIVPRKKSKVKDTIHLIYDINEKCEDIYKILKKRVDLMLDED